MGLWRRRAEGVGEWNGRRPCDGTVLFRIGCVRDLALAADRFDVVAGVNLQAWT